MIEIANPQFVSLPLATVVGGVIAFLAIRANHHVRVQKINRLEEEYMQSRVNLMNF